MMFIAVWSKTDFLRFYSFADSDSYLLHGLLFGALQS